MHYRDQYHCFATHGLTFKDADKWRVIKEPVLGEINGLPASHGLLVATNGILCLIERADSTTFEGHLEWFVAHNPREQEIVDEQKAVQTNTRKRLTQEEARKIMEDLCEP